MTCTGFNTLSALAWVRQNRATVKGTASGFTVICGALTTTGPTLVHAVYNAAQLQEQSGPAVPVHTVAPDDGFNRPGKRRKR